MIRSTVAHVGGWEAHDLHDLGLAPWIYLCRTDPARHLMTAGEDLNHLEKMI